MLCVRDLSLLSYHVVSAAPVGPCRVKLSRHQLCCSKKRYPLAVKKYTEPLPVLFISNVSFFFFPPCVYMAFLQKKSWTPKIFCSVIGFDPLCTKVQFFMDAPLLQYLIPEKQFSRNRGNDEYRIMENEWQVILIFIQEYLLLCMAQSFKIQFS